MSTPRRLPWIPAFSFALAAVLAFAVGPSRRAIGRLASSSTACMHDFVDHIPKPKCLESETNNAVDNPANCQNVTPPKGTHWYAQIEGQDAQWLVSIVSDGAANNGGLLGPVPEVQIDADKQLTGGPCDPCHGVSYGAQATATVVARLGHAQLPFDFTVSSSVAVVTVSRTADCGGPNDTKSAVAYILAARFMFPALPPGERTSGFVIEGEPGNIELRPLRPVINNENQFPGRGIASLDLASGNIKSSASATFQGRAQVLSLKAPLSNANVDADSGAQAAGRLGDLTLVDTDEGKGN